jgi:hypothetical protein
MNTGSGLEHENKLQVRTVRKCQRSYDGCPNFLLLFKPSIFGLSPQTFSVISIKISSACRPTFQKEKCVWPQKKLFSF